MFMNREKLMPFVLLMIVVGSVNSIPTGSSSNSTDNEDAENLRHTFGDNEEIPAGFFDSGYGLEKKNSRDERQVFPACQDGSGGFCIPLGQCKNEDKPTKSNSKACGQGEECCYALPPSNTPCRNKGGECVKPPLDCNPGGPGIRFTSGTECDHANGEKCCVWVF